MKQTPTLKGPVARPSDRTLVNGLSGAKPLVALLTGGGDRPYALGLATSLAERGMHLDFIGSDFLESDELRRCPEVRFLNLRGDMRPEAPMLQKVLRVARYYIKLIAYAATAEPKVFHILWNNKVEWFDRTLLLLYYRLIGKKIVHTVHNVNIRKRDGTDSAWNRLTLRIQYRLAHHLFVHTQQMRRELQADFDVRDAKVSVIPFAVNDTVPNTTMDRAEARRRCGLHASDQVILFYGNIAPYKGAELLVEALSQVSEALPRCRLIIAGRPKGPASYWVSVEQKIEALGLRSRVVPRIEYIPDAETEIYFKAADVLCLPYTQVFQSGVLFLGYNFGIPVIASDVGSLRDDIVEGRTGLICKPGDAGDLARTLLRFFSDRPPNQGFMSREEIAAMAREKYSWSSFAMTTHGLYLTLLAQAPPVPRSTTDNTVRRP